MSGEHDEFQPLRRRPAESPEEWAARLCEFLHACPRPVTGFTDALPELLDSPDALLDLIALHRQLRVEAGEFPQADEYTAQFPTLADAIREQFQIDEVLDAEATGSFHSVIDDDPPPALPPRFRFVRWLGSGGYGRVCECEDTHHARRRVAVKLLQEFRAAVADAERFRREAELVARLNHPNLCTLYEFDFAHQPPFLVLEFIDGPTVGELIAAEAVPIREAVRVAHDAAAALAHCHAAGVIHRDLKPDNIKRRPDGVVKVLDLGLARELVPDAGAWTSDERAMVGTVPYFSPEHFAGCPEAPADQFSLGIVLYEMLTGVRPFAGDTVLELHTAVTATVPRSPRDRRPEVDDRLAGIVLKMLARNPEERFPSLDAVRTELDGCLKGTDSEREPVSKPLVRRWWKAAAAAAVLAAGAAAWWRFGGVPPAPVTPGRQEVVAPAQPQDLTAVLSRIAADLAAMPAPDQEHQRYFRLGHLDPAERGNTRDALAALLPKLSASGAVVPLTDANGDGTLLRFDLRALGWKADEEWPRVVRRCPLSLRYAGTDLPAAGGTIRKLLNTDLTPFVLADWFVAAVVADPLLGEVVPDELADAVRENGRLRQFREGYDRTPVDRRRAAAELGLSSPDPLKDLLLAKDELTRRLELSPWLEDEPVPRSVWNRVEVGVCPAAELATELKLGIRRIVALP